MQTIKDLLQVRVQPKKVSGGKRGVIIGELYDLYLGDKLNRKKENWKRYVLHLKSERLRDTKENQVKFRRSKLFLKEYSLSSFCYLLSHIKTPELPILLSIAKDKKARKENVGGYIGAHFSH
jgi:hypothetical protein